jgi:hypothetical protein
MQQKSEEFIEELANRTHPILIRSFDKDHWFRGAYSTVQRTFRKKPLTTDRKEPLAPDQKTMCSNILFDRDRGLASLGREVANDPASFDRYIQELIENIAAVFNITNGHAQKLVNILLKYYACLYHSAPQAAWAVGNNWIGNILKCQHVPIDSIVLYWLEKERAPEDCQGFVRSRRFLNKRTNRYDYSAEISHEEPPAWLPWSKIRDYKEYSKVQGIIRKLANAKGIPPLLYEMCYLWKP